jgi:hypothetical protein
MTMRFNSHHKMQLSCGEGFCGRRTQFEFGAPLRVCHELPEAAGIRDFEGGQLRNWLVSNVREQ